MRGRAWLPLYNGTEIAQQPVDLDTLAQRYAQTGRDFIAKSARRRGGHGPPTALGRARFCCRIVARRAARWSHHVGSGVDMGI